MPDGHQRKPVYESIRELREAQNEGGNEGEDELPDEFDDGASAIVSKLKDVSISMRPDAPRGEQAQRRRSASTVTSGRDGRSSSLRLERGAGCGEGLTTGVSLEEDVSRDR